MAGNYILPQGNIIFTFVIKCIIKFMIKFVIKVGGSYAENRSI